MDPWKKAQEDVKKALAKVVRKDFLFKPFTDTYSAGGRVVQDQPSDFWALDQGRYYVLEVKSCHQNRFPMKDIRPSQMIAARRVPAAGGFSRFIFVKLPERLWFCMNGELIYNMNQAGERSIAWEQMTPIKLSWEAIA